MTRLYGFIAEEQLREAVMGAQLGTIPRAAAELLDEVENLRQLLRMFQNRPHLDSHGPCWCECAPFDDGTPRKWGHDTRCNEVREALDE